MRFVTASVICTQPAEMDLSRVADLQLRRVVEFGRQFPPPQDINVECGVHGILDKGEWE